jgi:hypothetical protein
MRFAIVVSDEARQAIAELKIGAECPINSVAPVFAITGMVADGLSSPDSRFDPVGETFKLIATGPAPHPFLKRSP